MAHKLSLLVPGLCGPLPGLEAIETAAGPLVALLCQADRQRVDARDYFGQLADSFGLKLAQGFPDAPLSLLGHGTDPGDHCWIHADPVNLLADMDRAVLADSQTLDIRRQEAEQLVRALNAHLAVDGITVLMADENDWFIRLDGCDLSTTPLRSVAGRNINHRLPEGLAAPEWRRLLNELQMLLHICEVNTQREQRGQAPVNSLWLWGEGVLPRPGSNDITCVYADDHAVSGLARLHRIPHAGLTDPIAVAERMREAGHTLVLIDQLDGPCNYSDTAAWLEAMLETVENWLEPLRQVAAGLDVELDIYPCNGVRYHFSHNNKMNIRKLMFWKKDHLGDHVETQAST